MQGSYVSWQWRMMQNLKRNLLVSSKLTWGIWRILTRALKNLKNLHFNGLLLNKVHNLWAKKSIGEFCLMVLNIFMVLKIYELKIYRGIISNDTEEWWKIWRVIELLFQNWHEEFDEFWPEHSEIAKICTLMGFFWTKDIMFQPKKRIRGF